MTPEEIDAKVTDILIHHFRVKPKGDCHTCGPQQLGRSFDAHITAILRKEGLLASPSTDATQHRVAEALFERYPSPTQPAILIHDDPRNVARYLADKGLLAPGVEEVKLVATYNQPLCPLCHSNNRFILRAPCSADQYEPHNWHNPRFFISQE